MKLLSLVPPLLDSKKRDEQVLGIIITALDDSYIHYIDEARTSYEAWILLERSFGAKAKHSKIALKMQLYGLTLEANEDLAGLINRLKSIVTQLVYIDCQVDEEDKVAVLLKALPASYDNIVTMLKEKEPIPSLQDVINSLQVEEKKQGSTFKVEGHSQALVLASSNRKCFTYGSSTHSPRKGLLQIKSM